LSSDYVTEKWMGWDAWAEDDPLSTENGCDREGHECLFGCVSSGEGVFKKLKDLFFFFYPTPRI
jgi:hypothetical protein